MITEAKPDFRTLYDRDPEAVASAPARVNLIGDHTDYNDGYVLPCALSLRTRAEAARRHDGRVRVWTASITGPESRTAEYHLGRETRRGDWVDYVQGVTDALAQAALPVSGFDLRLDSDIPLGAGLASSASLEVAVLRALRELFRWQLDDTPLAMLAHRAETRFVGVPVGVMDQMAASLARPHAALFLDTVTLSVEHIAMPRTAEMVVIHSGVTHAHATGTYRVRQRECEEACAELGVRRLRDLEGAGRQEVLARLETLPEPLGRRARHVVTENDRVVAAVEALRKGDVAVMGVLMNASHESLRADYEASSPELDLLVALARNDGAVYGARMTGGGFGGSVVILADAAAAEESARRIAGEYRAQSAHAPIILAPINCVSTLSRQAG